MTLILCIDLDLGREGAGRGREGGREEEREGGERKRKGGRERGREGGREEEREGGRKRGSREERGRKRRERKTGQSLLCTHTHYLPSNPLCTVITGNQKQIIKKTLWQH